ncbi:MAG TPA: thiolase family protein [Acidimicrobiia bacterium]
MRDVHVAGVGMTRFGKFPDSSVRSLAEEAAARALADADLPPGEVEMAFFANATAGILHGQEMIRGQVALRHTGLLGIPIVNVENACASASSAFYLAWMAVASGAVDVALAIGSEKLTHPDKEKTFAAIGTAVDLGQRAEMEARLGTSGGHRSFFMDIYAGMARDYMARSGATAEDFARVVVKNQHHGALNPNAQYGGERSVEEVLASREVAPPLTLLMCSPISDGAAAVVLCSPELAGRLGADVKVASTVLLSGRDRNGVGQPAAERAARRAFERAGIGPEDVDVVEVHDAAAPAELIVYEEVGLCGPGEGPKLLASGDTALGGRVPVNPSGGLLSKGHPIGATGCAQLVELVDQLRGRCGARQVEGARVALAENGGGFLGDDPAAVVITILSR